MERRARFEIKQGRNKQHYAHLKAPNGEIVAQSEGYVRRSGAVAWCNKLACWSSAAYAYLLRGE